MKKIIVITLCIWLSSILLGQNNEYTPLVDFTKIDVTDKIILQLERGTTNEIKLQVQGMERENVIVEVVDGTLKLDIVDELISGKVRATVKYKSLEEIYGSGMAEISTGNLIKDEHVKVVLKSGTNAYLDFDIKSLTAELVEGSLLQAEGYAVQQNITVKSSATFSGYDLEGEKVDVLAIFGGKAKVYAEKELNIDARTGSYICYKGKPEVKNIESKGGSTVESSTP